MTRPLTFVLCLALFGCDETTEVDAGSRDAGTTMDAGRSDASPGRDAGRTDGGTSDSGAGDAGGCPTGQHVCPTGCTPDNANDPANGCRLGCGTACVAPTGGEALCDSEGMCMASCTAPGVLDGDRCCGGALACSAGVNFLLACPMPSEEPNDDNLTARLVGTYDDEDGSMEGIGNLALPLDDEDFFRMNVTDSCCSTTTQVMVGVETALPGTVELSAWITCNSGTDSHTCNGTADSTHGFGCTTVATGTPLATGVLDFLLDCSGTTDEGSTVLMRVRPALSATMCVAYELSWRVYN